ncbi:phosphotransferase enzyme family protein [Aspergillus carlsbadensis]|nr:phosphotransferase enzyme family protein [Aspergillus carlsbadensis]
MKAPRIPCHPPYTNGSKQQLACRYVKFDFTALLRLAASAMGSGACTRVLKISEGQYNKVFLLTMDDGREVIAKLPNPNAGRPHFTTASEVATMDFLRNALSLPVPKVYAWSSRASENPLGAEYILMEKQAGVVLTDVWDTLKGKQRAQILDQVVDIERRLAATSFTKYGSLYYQKDLAHNAADSTSPLYIDVAGNEVRSKTFAIGPTNHRSFFDFGRGELDIDRGPWSTVTELMLATARREIATAKAGLRYLLTPEGLFYGPRQYQPSFSKKLSALESYLKVAPYVLPEDKDTHTSVLWHGDLHSQNIFVDPEDPARIVGIIDWQSVSTCPLFEQVRRPAFLDYSGPVQEELGKVHLPPNFESMDADEQRDATALHTAQSLHNLYLVRCLQRNKTVFQAIQGQNTLRHQVTVTPGLVLMDYEPLLNSLLQDFSDEETRLQEHDGDLWVQGVELMNTLVEDIGCFKHWDERVTDLDYEESKKQLDDGVERFLDREARSADELEQWLKALPFVD